MSTLILSASDVAKLVNDIPPIRLIELMKEAFQALSQADITDLSSSIQSPHRTSIETQKHTTLFMPSRLPSQGTAIKIVSVPKGPSDAGLPATTLLMDEETGSVKAIINAGSLTALRTAAGSLLATSLLQPREANPTEPKTMVLFGAGQQVEAHAKLFLSYYGSESIGHCYIINRSDIERLRATVQCLQAKFPTSAVTGFSSSDRAQTRSALSSADIIITATSSTEPLFPSPWIKSGAHINLIGSYKPSMKEIDSELIHRAKIILVDSKEACAKEAGELIEAGMVREAIDGTLTITDARVLEIGQVVGKADTLKVVEEIKRDVTIFKSVGVGVQDVAIAVLVVRLAEERRTGSAVLLE